MDTKTRNSIQTENKKGYYTQGDEEIERRYNISSEEKDLRNKKVVLAIYNMPAIKHMPDRENMPASDHMPSSDQKRTPLSVNEKETLPSIR